MTTTRTRTIVYMRELSTTVWVEHAPRIEVYRTEDDDYEIAFQYTNNMLIAHRQDAIRVANAIADLLEVEL